METFTASPEAPQLKSADDVQELPKQFDRDGFSHTQVFGRHPVYVYRKSRGGFWHTFEVIKTRLRGDA